MSTIIIFPQPILKVGSLKELHWTCDMLIDVKRSRRPVVILLDFQPRIGLLKLTESFVKIAPSER